jgi:hypothetical protein
MKNSFKYAMIHKCLEIDTKLEYNCQYNSFYFGNSLKYKM